MKYRRENPDLRLHRQLRSLPGPEAPGDLIEKVLARIASPKPLPWWKRPWLEWPRVPRLLSVGLLAASAEILYLSWAGLVHQLQGWAADIPGASQLYHQAQAAGTAMGHRLDSLFGSVQFPWLTVAGVTLLCLYLGVMGMGVLFYQVLSRHQNSVK